MFRPMWPTIVYAFLAALGIGALVALAALSVSAFAAKTAALAAIPVGTATTIAVRAATHQGRRRRRSSDDSD